MARNTVFTQYDLEKETPDEIQFEIMEMPDFFHKNGDAPKQAHIHTFYQIICFNKVQAFIMSILKNIQLRMIHLILYLTRTNTLFR